MMNNRIDVSGYVGTRLSLFYNHLKARYIWPIKSWGKTKILSIRHFKEMNKLRFVYLLAEQILSYSIQHHYFKNIFMNPQNPQSLNPQQAPQQNQQPKANQQSLQPQTLQGNHQHLHSQAPSADPEFERDFAQTQLKLEKMLAQIMALQIWRDYGGPQNASEIKRCTIYLQNLKEIRLIELRSKSKLPKFFTSIRNWFHVPRRQNSTLKTKLTNHQESKTVYKLHRQSQGSKINLDQETKPLKQQ